MNDWYLRFADLINVCMGEIGLGLSAGHPEGRDVALLYRVGLRAVDKPRFGGVAVRFVRFFLVRPFSDSIRGTVHGLAGIRKNRRSRSAIRRVPYLGWQFLGPRPAVGSLGACLSVS